MTVRAELARVVDVLARATAGEWLADDDAVYDKVGNRLASFAASDLDYIKDQENAAATVAAINFLRDNHATLAAALEQGEADRVRLAKLAAIANGHATDWTHPSGDGFRRTFEIAPGFRATIYERRAFTADDLREALDAAIDAAIRAREGECRHERVESLDSLPPVLTCLDCQADLTPTTGSQGG